jgi:hypothetical protein
VLEVVAGVAAGKQREDCFKQTKLGNAARHPDQPHTRCPWLRRLGLTGSLGQLIRQVHLEDAFAEAGKDRNHWRDADAASEEHDGLVAVKVDVAKRPAEAHDGHGGVVAES